MPLYDYQCKSCSHEFEALQAMNEAPLEECPECDEPELRKKVAAPAFTFKGGGWYKDLYSSSSSSGNKSGETKSDSGAAKPAAKESSSKTTAAAS